MDELEKAVRQYYATQRLPGERAEAILAAGRAAAERKTRLTRWTLAAAALVVVGLGVGLTVFATKSAEGTQNLAMSDIPSAVVTFFADPKNALSQVSTDRVKLEKWLSAHAAPAGFSIPPPLARLNSFAFHVFTCRLTH